MSADFIHSQIRAASDDPYNLDWTAGRAACAMITADDLRFFDSEERDLVVGEHAEGDESPTDTAAVLRWATDTLDMLRRTLVEEPEAYSVINVGTGYLYLTGGLSFGDSPCDAFDAIWDAHHLPLSVLQAVGFESPVPATPSPELLDHAAADFSAATSTTSMRVYAALDAADDIIVLPAEGDIPPAARYLRHADGAVTSETI